MRTFVFYFILEIKKFDSLKKVVDEINGINFVEKSLWVYQVFPFKTADILLWFSFDFENEDILPSMLSKVSSIFYKEGVVIRDVLWGFTKPSIYSKTQKSVQEIDPFSKDRKKYLIVYPFVKTAEWYLLKQDTRQGMMNEHIRIGRQYPSILQLLLYCFGLSDNEFVVSYETDSIVEFEKLVYDLRSSEARKYTLRDTPIYTGVFRKLDEFKDILL